MTELNDLKNAGIYQEWWSNPGIVGLMGFALTTMVTGLHNAGYFGAGPTLALALAFGGTAQFVAGVIDLRKGNLFGGSAFMSYGAFWWSVYALVVWLPAHGIKPDGPQLAAFFFVWAMFTFAFVLAVFKHGKFLSILFILLFIAFILLVLKELGKASPMLVGWEIFITGALAWYIAMAILVNTTYGKTVLPLS